MRPHIASLTRNPAKRNNNVWLDSKLLSIHSLIRVLGSESGPNCCWKSALWEAGQPADLFTAPQTDELRQFIATSL